VSLSRLMHPVVKYRARIRTKKARKRLTSAAHRHPQQLSEKHIRRENIPSDFTRFPAFLRPFVFTPALCLQRQLLLFCSWLCGQGWHLRRPGLRTRQYPTVYEPAAHKQSKHQIAPRKTNTVIAEDIQPFSTTSCHACSTTRLVPTGPRTC
jgi:hypothetical protein